MSLKSKPMPAKLPKSAPQTFEGAPLPFEMVPRIPFGFSELVIFPCEIGMDFSTAEAGMPAVLDVSVSEKALTVELSDGRTLSVPTGWYPRLVYAKAEERANWTIIDGGQGIRWRELDEDVSLAGLLAGRASSEGRLSLQRWLDRRSEDR